MDRLIEILLVEDNPADIRLYEEALKESNVLSNLNKVKDGQEALDFIFKKNSFQDVVTPDIIVLDLNLPKVNGKDVLKVIKNDPVVKKIPVVILTSSKSEEDISRSYELHANSYITKPLDFNQFIKIIEQINQFWLSTVDLPPKE